MANDRMALYEKLYFHEIEMREKLHGQLQTPLTIIAALGGGLVFLLQNVEGPQVLVSRYPFGCFVALSCAALSASIIFFVLSWFNSTYSFIPSASENEEYRKVLLQTYEGYSDGEILAMRHWREAICTYYVTCSSHVSEVVNARHFERVILGVDADW